jgi:hypothetical protein
MGRTLANVIALVQTQEARQKAGSQKLGSMATF